MYKQKKWQIAAYVMTKIKYQKLQFKLSMLFLSLAMVLSLALSTFSYMTAKSNYTSFYTDKIREIACYAATLVDGDKIGTYLVSGQKDAYYAQLQRQFDILKQEHDLMYLFIFKPTDADFIYILEAVKKGDDLSLIGELGQHDVYPDVVRDSLVTDLKEKRPSQQPIIIDDHYGYVTSAFAPVLNQHGEVVAVVQADLSMHKVLSALYDYVKATVAIISVGVLLFMLILLISTRKLVTEPIKSLTGVALNFAAGEKLVYTDNNLKTGDEIQSLAEAFNKMAKDIEHYVDNISRISAERERIATELSVATSIQMSMIPRTFPAFPERSDLDIYALIEPAKEVGGDFYDFFMLGEDKLGFVIADVSGKGIPAALFMMISKSLIKNYALSGMTAAEILSTANNALCENNDSDMFVTVFAGILDMKTGKLNYANAGHNPPLIQKQEEIYSALPVKRGFVLAGMENIRYTDQEICLSSGDRLFLYTDGVSEAMNKALDLYSDQRIMDRLNSMSPDFSLNQILDAMKEDVDGFADGAEQADDITMMILEYKARGDGGE